MRELACPLALATRGRHVNTPFAIHPWGKRWGETETRQLVATEGGNYSGACHNRPAARRYHPVSPVAKRNEQSC